MQKGGQIVRCEIEQLDRFKNIRSREGITSQRCWVTQLMIDIIKKVRQGWFFGVRIRILNLWYFSFSSPSVGGRIDDQTGRETREKISKWTRESSLLIADARSRDAVFKCDAALSIVFLLDFENVPPIIFYSSNLFFSFSKIFF